MSQDKRLVIVYDGYLWHVRKLAYSVHNGPHDEKIYHCDEPIGNDMTFEHAIECAKKYLGRR